VLEVLAVGYGFANHSIDPEKTADRHINRDIRLAGRIFSEVDNPNRLSQVTAIRNQLIIIV
jgi:hypothetical protein